MVDPDPKKHEQLTIRCVSIIIDSAAYSFLWYASLFLFIYFLNVLIELFKLDMSSCPRLERVIEIYKEKMTINSNECLEKNDQEKTP